MDSESLFKRRKGQWARRPNKFPRLKSIQERRSDEVYERQCQIWRELMSPICEYFKSTGQYELSNQLKKEEYETVKMEDEPAIEDFISFPEQFGHPSKLPKKKNKSIRKQDRQNMEKEESKSQEKKDDDQFLENVMKNEEELFNALSSNDPINLDLDYDLWRF